MTYPRYDPGSPPPALPRPWPPPPPPPPRKRAVQLWLIGALVSLLVTLGIGLAFVINDDPARVAAELPPQSAPGDGDSQSAENRPIPAPPADCLVECTQVPSPGGSDTEAHHSGSVDTAAAFVQDIANGNVASAHDALCGDGKNQFPTPEEFLANFYTTFGISEISGARLTDVHAADDASDAVVFELDTDVGTVTADVFVVEEASSLTVCGYEVAL